MEFLKANGMYFAVRLKKTVNVDDKPITALTPGIYKEEFGGEEDKFCKLCDVSSCRDL